MITAVHRSGALAALALWLITAPGLAAAAAAGSATTAPLVLAAASLAPVLTEIVAAYDHEGRHDGGTALTFSFGPSGALARQIVAGAPADLFITADPAWIDWTRQAAPQKVAAVTSFAGNRLVLAQPATATLPLALDAALPQRLGGGRLAIGDDRTAPVGRYAREALQRLGLWEALTPMLVRASDARALLALTRRGEVAAAMLYYSDALSAGNAVRIVAMVPETLHGPIVYQVAVLRGGRGGEDAAQRFVAFLDGAVAQQILARAGFTVPPGDR